LNGIRAILSAVLISQVACTADPTQLVVFVESDRSSESITGFVVRAQNDRGEVDTAEWRRTGVPLSLGILPPEGELERPLTIEISTAPEKRTVRRSIARFVKNRVIELHVCISDRCAGDSGCNEIYQPILSIDDLAAIDEDANATEMAARCFPMSPAPPEDGGTFEDAGESAEAGTPDVPEPGDAGLEDSGLPMPAQPAWARRIGGVMGGNVEDVLIDRNGHVFIAGQRNNRGFIARYSPDGTLLWPEQFTGGTSDVFAVAEGPGAEIYVTGTFDGIVHAGTATLTPPGTMKDVFVLHYDTSTNVPVLLHTLVLGATGEQRGRGIAFGTEPSVEPHAAIYLAGDFKARFGSGDCSLRAPNANKSDIFLLALAPDLSSCLWGHSIHTTEPDTAHELQFGRGRLVLAGVIKGAAHFDNEQEPLAENEGAEDLFFLQIPLADRAQKRAIAAGGEMKDENPRVMITDRIHLTGDFDTSAIDVGEEELQFSTGSIPLKISVDATLSVTVSPSYTELTASATTAQIRGLAGDDGRQIVSGHFTGRMTIGETILQSTPAQETNGFVAFVDRGNITEIFSFGGGAEVEVRRMAGSDTHVAVVGNYSLGPMTFPDRDVEPLTYTEDADGFLYYFPRR
jgi:hypothetical protein